MQRIPTLADIQAAARRLRGVATRTPLLPVEALSEQLGRPVLVKAETLQRTGSFKFRGAYNRIVQLDASQRRRGVVAFSSGNHAQGVAAAARLCGVEASIVMPSDAPRTKIDGTRHWGAEVVFYDRESESREAIAQELADRRGAVLIPSFDDPDIIAGQGTVGLEIVRDVVALGLRLDMVVTPIGGGGLAGGLGIALEVAAPEVALWGVEPAGFDDVARSLESGRIVGNARRSGSVQDALLTPEISPLTFTLLQRHVRGMTQVDDAQAIAACQYAQQSLKLVVEPGGAAALAAVLAGQIAPGEGAVVIVLSGGNADS